MTRSNEKYGTQTTTHRVGILQNWSFICKLFHVYQTDYKVSFVIWAKVESSSAQKQHFDASVSKKLAAIMIETVVSRVLKNDV